MTPALLINAVSAVACLGYVLFCLLNQSALRQSFIFGSYYFLTVLVILWFLSLVNTLRPLVRNNQIFLRKMLWIACLSLAALGVVVKTVPIQLKIFNDEVRLLSVSKSMIEERRCDSVSSAVNHGGKIHVLKRQIEKRSLLFPYLAHALHAVRGYHINNVYAVNLAAAFFILLAVGASVVYFAGSVWWGIASVFLMLSHPVFSVSATSGGMEMVNLLFWVVSFLALDLFLNKREELYFRLLVLSLILLGHSRYESILEFLIIAGLLLAAKLIKLDFFRRSPVYAAVPWFFLPILFQRWLKLNSQEPLSVGAPFGLSYFFQNNRIFLKSLFRFDLGVNSLINALGVVALIFLAVGFFRRRGSLDIRAKCLFAAIFTSAAAFWVVVTAYYAGAIEGRFSARLFFPHLLLFCVALIYLVRSLSGDKKRPAVLFCVASVALAVLYFPLAAQNVGVQESYFRMNYEDTLRLVRQHPDKDSVYICTLPEYLLTNGYSAVSFEFARKNKSMIMNLMRQGIITKLLAIQSVNIKSGHVSTVTRLPKYLQNKERLTEVQKNASAKFVLTRVDIK